MRRKGDGNTTDFLQRTGHRGDECSGQSKLEVWRRRRIRLGWDGSPLNRGSRVEYGSGRLNGTIHR